MKQKVEGVWYENPKCEGDSSCPLWSVCDTLHANECYPCFDKPRCTPPASILPVQEGCPMLIQSREDCVTRCIFQPNKKLSLIPVATECVTNCSSDLISKSLKCVLTDGRPKWNQTIPDWLTVRERTFTTLGSTVFTSTSEIDKVSLGAGPESLPSVYDPVSVMIPSSHIVLFSAVMAAMLIVLTVCVILLTKSFSKLRCRKTGTSNTEESESLQRSNSSSSSSSSAEVLDQNLNIEFSNGSIAAAHNCLEMNSPTTEPKRLVGSHCTLHSHIINPHHDIDPHHGIDPHNEINRLHSDGDQRYVAGSQQFFGSDQGIDFRRGDPEEHDEGSDYHLRSVYSLTQQEDAQRVTDSEISSHLESLHMRTAREDSNDHYSLVDIYHQTC